jgi:hypothetical protein
MGLLWLFDGSFKKFDRKNKKKENPKETEKHEG